MSDYIKQGAQWAQMDIDTYQRCSGRTYTIAKQGFRNEQIRNFICSKKDDERLLMAFLFTNLTRKFEMRNFVEFYTLDAAILAQIMSEFFCSLIAERKGVQIEVLEFKIVKYP